MPYQAGSVADEAQDWLDRRQRFDCRHNPVRRSSPTGADGLVAMSVGRDWHPTRLEEVKRRYGKVDNG
jgi:hypothetical protein